MEGKAAEIVEEGVKKGESDGAIFFLNTSVS